MTTQKYTKVAVILHWLIAIIILSMFALGWYMTGLPKDAPKAMAYDLFDLGLYTWELGREASPRTFYFGLHKSVGITVLALIMLRLFWRITHRPPALPLSLKAWEKKLATAGHHLLYLLMVVMPVSGAMMAISSKYGIKWFDIKLVGGLDDHGMREVFEEVHEVAAIVMFFVVLIHVAGALKHLFIDKDDVHKRMTLTK